jgi:hypothetical protein
MNINIINSNTQARLTEGFPLLGNSKWSCTDNTHQLHRSRFTSLGNISFLVECCCYFLMRQTLDETAFFYLFY